MTAVHVDGESVSLAGLRAVACDGAAAVLAPDARQRMARSRAVVERALAADSVIYGVTTGFGKLADVRVPHDGIERLQLNLLRSHAAGTGAPLDETEVRGALLIRANSLARGHSGIRPEVVELLLALLDRRVHPVVPSRGSVGASGDLAPSAHLSLVLVGEGEAWLGGERLPGAVALERAGLAPLRLQAKEGLSLLNGTHFMAAVGGLACARALTLIDSADAAGALTLEVLLGTPVAADARIQRVRPHPGQIASARNLSRLLAGSAIVASRLRAGSGRLLAALHPPGPWSGP